MRRFRHLGYLTLLLIALPCLGGGQALVSRKGTKCLTAMNGVVVGSACNASPAQAVVVNFAVGGLELGGRCLRRDGNELTLAACRPGDTAEVFAIDSATSEIVSSAPTRACAGLGQSGEWRPNQPVTLAPCNASLGQKWLLAAWLPQAGKGTSHANDTQGELKSGDFLPLNGQYLVIK